MAWLKMVRLVARLQKIEDVVSLLPLYLKGDALAFYMEIEETSQRDAEQIEAWLKEAFTDDVFTGGLLGTSRCVVGCVACRILKKSASLVTSGWDMWVDASSLVIRVALERHETVLEDAGWLRPENYAQHINLVKTTGYPTL